MPFGRRVRHVCPIHWSIGASEKWYSNYCVNKGVPAAEAHERLVVGTSKLLLAEVDQESGNGD